MRHLTHHDEINLSTSPKKHCMTCLAMFGVIRRSGHLTEWPVLSSITKQKRIQGQRRNRNETQREQTKTSNKHNLNTGVLKTK